MFVSEQAGHRIEPEAPIAEIPPLIEALIDDLTEKGVLPLAVRPDTVIVNVYNEGDCIPPHVDHPVYPRPFCAPKSAQKKARLRPY